MKSYNKLREFLSNIEHEQWIYWSKSLATDLRLLKVLCEKKEYAHIIDIIDSRLDRWYKNWKPYQKLSDDAKDSDREWADKILDSLPIRCPMYQCGGFMEAKERRMSKGFLAQDWEHWKGDEQSPDLICTNCKAVYQFQGFKVGKEFRRPRNRLQNRKML